MESMESCKGARSVDALWLYCSTGTRRHMVDTRRARGRRAVSRWSARCQRAVSRWSACGQHVVSPLSARSLGDDVHVASWVVLPLVWNRSAPHGVYLQGRHRRPTPNTQHRVNTNNGGRVGVTLTSPHVRPVGRTWRGATGVAIV